MENTTHTGEELTTAEDTANIPVTKHGDMVIGGFAFTPTALVPNDPDAPPDFESWEQVGQFLRYVHTGTQFWLGDWINFGEARYGEKYAQAVESTGYELKTLQTYAWVARQVPRSNRVETVPFGHYLNGIAAKAPEEQARLVKRVQDEGLTQTQLRDLLAEERAAKGDKPVDLWLVVLCKDQKDFDRLEKQMREQGREVTSRVTAHKVEKKPKADKPAKAKKSAGQTPKAANTTKLRTKTEGAKAKAETIKGEAATQVIVDYATPYRDEQGRLTLRIPPNETADEKKKRLKRQSNLRMRDPERKA